MMSLRASCGHIDDSAFVNGGLCWACKEIERLDKKLTEIMKADCEEIAALKKNLKTQKEDNCNLANCGHESMDGYLRGQDCWGCRACQEIAKLKEELKILKAKLKDKIRGKS